MKTTVTLNLRQLKQAELTQLIVSSLDTLAQKEIQVKDSMASSLIERLKANLPELKASLKQEHGSNLTQDLTKALRLRNDDIIALSNGIKTYKASRSADKHKAYQELLHLINNYKDMKHSSLEESSALVTSLLTKLESASYSSKISLLNLEELITNLKDSQSKLYQLYLQRSQETSTKTVVNSSKVREMIEEDYKLLYSHLQNKLKYDGNDDCKVMIQLLNDIRQDYAEQIKRRKGKGGNKADDDDKTEPSSE